MALTPAMQSKLPMLYSREVQGALQLIDKKLTPPPGYTQDEFNCQLIVMLMQTFEARREVNRRTQVVLASANVIVAKLKEDIAAIRAKLSADAAKP